MIIVSNLEKSYGTNQVLKGVSVTFEPGSIHALLGPNGAGKSTFLGCLSGAVRPDAGTIELGGTLHAGFTPRSALEAGTGIIYQHFQLVEDLSIVDNLFLGDEQTSRLGFTNQKKELEEASDVLHSLGLEIDVRTLVRDLTVGQQQIVEIARAMRRNPLLLILDEPTAALSNTEITTLLELVRSLAARGIAIIYVTHLLKEVLAISDHTTVIRDGQVFLSDRTEHLSLDQIIDAISPRDIRSEACPPSADLAHESAPLFTATELQCEHSGPISFVVRPGEIVGIYGLLGSGRTDLLETIAGVRRQLGGELTLEGKLYRARTPARAIAKGVALVAGDRRAQSLFPEMTSLENLLMPAFRQLSRIFRKPSAERSAFTRVAELVGLRPPSPHFLIDNLSGGNAQKIAVGRWLTGKTPTLLLLDEPTQGVDIGAREDIYRLLRELARENGIGVIFASSDPDETLALADRVLAISDGKLLDIGSQDLTETRLAALVHSAHSLA